MAEPRFGSPASEALLRFLALQGRGAARPAVDRLLNDSAAPAALAAVLKAHGWEARPARVEAGLALVSEGPTLVEAAEGGWLVLAPAEGGRVRVWGAAGESLESARTLPALLGGWFLEVWPGAPSGASLFQRALHHLSRHRRALARIAAASLLMQGLALLGPQFTRLALDQALPSGGGSLLTLLALGLGLSVLFQAWIGWLRKRTLLYLETRLEAELGRGFMGHVLSLPFALLQRHRLGDLLQSQNGLEAARSLLTERLLGNVLDGVLALGTLAAMASLMPGPTAAVLLGSLAMMGIVVAVGRAQERLQGREVEVQALQRGRLVELIHGIATLKAAGAEGAGLHGWLTQLGTELGLALRRQRVALWNDVGLDGLRQGLNALLLVWGGRLVLQGEAQVGALVAFVQLSAAYLTAMLGLSQAYLGWRLVGPQVARTQALLAEAPEPIPPATPSHPLRGEVRVEDLWFRYGPDLPWVLQGYELRVAPGEKRWIQAPSGFGKSTLLRVLAGLYDPERGTVRFDGQRPAFVKGQVAYLPQAFQLVEGSLQENLRLLSGGAPWERILEAAEGSGLATIVRDLPMGYQTLLVQGGGNLSGGQRQLLALTAVMACDCRILLLDEAMANLDWVSRKWFHQSPWFEGKTVIYASHDAGLG